MYNHYIEIDSDDLIITAFSDAFVEPGPNSIRVAQSENRHFNPRLHDDSGELLYRWAGGIMLERPAAERVPTGTRLTAWAEAKCDEVDAEWERRRRLGFLYSDGHYYPLNEGAQIAYTAQLYQAERGRLSTPYARTVDNGNVVFTPETFAKFGMAAFAAVEALQSARVQAKDAIRACTTYEAALAAFNAYMGES